MTLPVKRKKVVFMLQRLYPGGAERVLISLMNNLDRDKYDIHFVSWGGEGTIRHWIDDDITFHALNQKGAVGTMFRIFTKIWGLKPDVVMTTMVQANATLLLFKPFFPKVRFIVRESSLPCAMVDGYGKKGILCRYIYKFLYPISDLVISPAQMIIDEFRDIIGISTDNHAVLYNPVNERRLHSTISHFDHDDEHRKKTVRFICVGRLGYEKGYDRLIESLADFQLAGGYDWKLDIIGKGSETKKLGCLIREHGLQNHIRLAGYLNTPWPNVAEADCLLLPSRWEGMPNVVLEALACGTRVIGHTDAGGINEIFALAEAGDVELASDMQSFVEKMSFVEPRLASLPIQTKLPREFALKNVMRKFETLL